MCPSSQETVSLAQTSAMSYRAVTAGKPKALSEVSKKNSLYKTGKKLEKHPDEWQSQLDHSDHLNTTHVTTQSGSTLQISQTNYHNNYQNNYSNPYAVGYTEKASSQVRLGEPTKAPDASKLSEPKSVETGLADTSKVAETARSPDLKHAVLSEEELATFRTSFCTKHHQNKCPNSDSCEKSHCLTWQRRNPYEISYCPHLCPEIQFVKKSRKMVLYRRCTRGKNCNFAHSKEEELYHPLVYKTKQCSAYPKCSRYFCPFVHDPSEMRDVTKFKSAEPPVTKEKDDMADTSFEFDCLDTLNDPETFRENSYETFNPNESNFTKERERMESPERTERVEKAERAEKGEKSEKVEDQMTQLEGDLGEGLKSTLDSSMWYDLPNLTMCGYDDSFKPLYEPYQPNETNYQYQNYQDEQYYNTNYPNLSSATTNSSNNYSTSSTESNYLNNTNYGNLGNASSNYAESNYMNYYNNYEQYGSYNEYNNYDYEGYHRMEEETGYGSNYSYNYDFGTDYLQYNSQELDEQFNNLNVKKDQDDYSLNDMLVKFINEIGDK